MRCRVLQDANRPKIKNTNKVHSMAKEMHQFINRSGDKLELACIVDGTSELPIYKGILLPCGRTAKPQIAKALAQIFIVYRREKWYLLG